MVNDFISKCLLDFKSTIGKTKPIDDPIPICFGISFKSKKVCRDWQVVQKNLANTLRSILNNSNSNYIIVVAGHEKPSLIEIENKKIKWITASFPPPIGPRGFNLDKRKKRILIGAYLKTINFNGFYMHLDADDLIHFKFVEYLNTLSFKKAFIIRESLMVNTNKKEIWLTKKFYQHCGSSSVIYFSTNELPRTSKKEKSEFSKLAFTSHKSVHLKFKKKDCLFIDKPIVLRVFGYGDNNMTIKKLLNVNVSSQKYSTKGEILRDWIWEHFRI
ncbi:hypothetical protein M3936_04395 [Sutcliffiella horikoshii]|uniref:hypothetical protein n=1 Tax=Sutcliffiella horikoshii TaxID=79883 RepID=UPI00203A61CD|nr:hypothetical protein [Sutcliffiella horikoshii]MCM3616818.1 hypothetical protein [Sutcliffiella horikoshii]